MLAGIPARACSQVVERKEEGRGARGPASVARAVAKDGAAVVLDVAVPSHPPPFTVSGMLARTLGLPTAPRFFGGVALLQGGAKAVEGRAARRGQRTGCRDGWPWHPART